MAQTPNTELIARIAALEAENDTLRALANGGDRDTAALSESVSPHRARRLRSEGPWGWTLLATVLIVIGALLAPIAIISTWATHELSNTDTFVATFGPLADDPDVQAYVTTASVAAIEKHLDIDQLTNNVIDGITSLGTGPRATQALDALKGPAAAGLKTLVSNTVSNFVKSDAFKTVWNTALRTSHTQMLKTLNNDNTAVVITGTNGAIGIQLGPIIEQVKQVLVDKGLTLANRIPAVHKTIVVADSSSLGTAQAIYPLANALGSWLPWIALLFLAAGVVVARRRALALIWAAVALAVVSIMLAAGYGIAHVLFVNAVSAQVPSRAADAIYDQVIAGMQSTTTAIIVLAITVAIVAWFAGPFRYAGALRGLAASGFGWVRKAAENHGITTGRVGEWIYAQRLLCRVLIALIAAAVVLFVRPLSAGLIIWTLVLAVVALAILELVQRPAVIVPETIDEDTDILIET